MEVRNVACKNASGSYFTEEPSRQSLTIHSLSMIALAGMIGTGLFLSSGSALAQSGPLGCLLGFIVVGVCLKSALPINKWHFRRWALLLLR